MAWDVPALVIVGQILTAAFWNLQVKGNFDTISTHTHSGAAGQGSSSPGPMVSAKFTTAAAPSAPGAGTGLLYVVTGDRPGFRAGAAGAAEILVTQDAVETLTNKTLTAPTIADFTNANHDHLDTDDGGLITGLPLMVVKAATETVNNSTTLQDDDELLFSVAANSVYLVDMWLRTTGLSAAPTAPNMKFAWSLPASATHNTMAQGTPSTFGDGTGGAPAALGSSASGSGTIALVVGGNEFLIVHLHAVIRTGANAGTATLQWAQNTAISQDTQILIDSYVIAHKAA